MAQRLCRPAAASLVWERSPPVGDQESGKAVGKSIPEKKPFNIHEYLTDEYS